MRLTFMHVLPIVISIAACGPPKELSREQAIEVLKAKSAELLTDDVWVLPTAFSIMQGQENRDCLLEYRLTFLNRLVEKGVLTSKKSATQVSGYNRGTRYEFSVKDPSYAKERDRSSFGGEMTSFVMGKPEFKEVTGVRQEGGTAVAEVTVHNEPTPLLGVLAEVEAELGYDICSSGYTFPPDRTKSYLFRRYDDGWRLVVK